MPPCASIESHSSTAPFDSITMSQVEGSVSAAYSPATPHPTMTTSHAIPCASISRTASTSMPAGIPAPCSALFSSMLPP